MTYQEFKTQVITLIADEGLTGIGQYNKYAMNNPDSGFPVRPAFHYGEEWEGWKEFMAEFRANR